MQQERRSHDATFQPIALAIEDIVTKSQICSDYYRAVDFEDPERPPMHIQIETALVGVVWLMQYVHGSSGPSNAAAAVFPLWN
jgi:hypothetical protein